MSVEIEPDNTAREIRDFLRTHPQLIYEVYRTDQPLSLNGACYVAAESYYHAKGGQDSALDIFCLSWSEVYPDGEGTHWYLRDDEANTWVDLALDDRDQALQIPFHEGRRRAFITGYQPSKRTKRVLSALNIAI